MKKIDKTGLLKKVSNFSIMQIEPPKYYIGRLVFNEYEIRNFLAEVAEGTQKWGVVIKDINGCKWRILQDARLEPINHNNLCPFGWDFIGNSMIKILKYRRLNDITIKK